ncbi:MAG: type II/IV secretion system ATPase subunit [Candidatus Thermoplasmatota archaeon]|nr:type II/IV secretion system ATPase subunit [Candidatus Thermoplasmatota archaeon]
MGLLEQAQLKREQNTSNSEILENDPSVQENENENILTGSGLLAKASQKRNKPTYPCKDDDFSKNTTIVEEKKGFGWKGQGIRRIIKHNETGEFFYQTIEPQLTPFETELKKEITHLFKMLADIDVSGKETEERKEYLEKTLEQIITDNDIKFYPVKKKETESKKTFKELIQFKKSKDTQQRPSNSNHSFLIDSLKKRFDKDLKREEKERLEQIAKRSKDTIFYHLFKEFLGYGRIDIVMKDDGIEDISCDGPDTPIFIYHKKYDELTTNIYFDTPLELDSFVIRLAQICGKQISIFSPIVDGKLPDGSRLQSTLAKTVTRGSTFTIRRFRENPLTPVDLVNFKSLSLDMAAYFWMAIEGGASVLFCGGTASGKTTALNALSLFIPPSHKIITIEDTREISLPHKNWIAGTTRQGFSSSEDTKTGKDIDMFDLIRAALRQRPKVVMVGEVRGKEAYSLFQAMATGHTSYATIHASTIHTLIQRLENPPISLPRALLTSLDIIVFQNAIDLGKKTVRRMTSVTEVIKLDPDTNQLIFMEPFKWVSKTDDRFERAGGSKILNTIRLQNNWNEEQLEIELEKRKTVLTWMIQKNMRDYRDVGRIVAEYERHPEKIVKKAEEELNQ